MLFLAQGDTFHLRHTEVTQLLFRAPLNLYVLHARRCPNRVRDLPAPPGSFFGASLARRRMPRTQLRGIVFCRY